MGSSPEEKTILVLFIVLEIPLIIIIIYLLHQKVATKCKHKTHKTHKTHTKVQYSIKTK